MDFRKEYLDLVLVPSGLLNMFSYHLFLLYKHHNNSDSTIIGLENKDRKNWVQSVVQGDRDTDLDRAVNVISANTSAASFLATISLTLSSVIGTWLGSSSSANNVFQSERIFGDTNPFTMFIKNICILTCLLLAFSGFVNSARHLIHANYLISSPDHKNLVKRVQFNITRGGDFMFFGLRALYFALNILLWFFGPIPMFVCSIIMVIILYYHDIHIVKLHDIYCEAGNQKGGKINIGGSFSY